MEINIGIIGISRGEKLIRLIKKTDLKLNIISVLDTDKKKLNFFKKKNPSIKIFSSQNKFFTDDKINAVYIASPVRITLTIQLKLQKIKNTSYVRFNI